MTKEYDRCVTCLGNKEVRGLGMMLEKCITCSGTGYVEKPSVELIQSDNNKEKSENNDKEVVSEAIVLPSNKRGRPKKNK